MSAGVTAVFEECRPRLLRFLRLRGAGDQADDLAQEVWLRAAAANGQPIANPEAFLMRVAHNVMIDWHRSDRQRALRERAWTEAQGEEHLETSPAPDAERAAIARSTLERAVAEIEALGEPTAGIFRRFRIEGTAQRDIAAALGVSLATVEKHLQKAYRAMAAFRARIDTE